MSELKCNQRAHTVAQEADGRIEERSDEGEDSFYSAADVFNRCFRNLASLARQLDAVDVRNAIRLVCAENGNGGPHAGNTKQFEVALTFFQGDQPFVVRLDEDLSSPCAKAMGY